MANICQLRCNYIKLTGLKITKKLALHAYYLNEWESASETSEKNTT